jgi:histidine ammonia-lyase
MLARANAMALGGAGVSPAVLDLLVALVNRDVTPIVPRWGSIGAGDLGLLAHIALGDHRARLRGARRPRASGRRRACAPRGLAPATLGPKDGLALCNGNALSSAWRASRLHSARRVLRQSEQRRRCRSKGYAANPSIFDHALAAAPSGRPECAAASVSARSSRIVALRRGAARSIQDALSFRLPVAGSRRGARRAGAAVVACELELNAAADNPLVLTRMARCSRPATST